MIFGCSMLQSGPAKEVTFSTCSKRKRTESSSGMQLCTWFAGIDLDSRCVTATLGFSTDDERPQVLGSKVFPLANSVVSAIDADRPFLGYISEIGKWFHLETGGALSDIALALPGELIREVSSAGACEFDRPTHLDADAIEIARQRAIKGIAQPGQVLRSVVRGYTVDGHPVAAPPTDAICSSLRVDVTSWIAKPAAYSLFQGISETGFDVGEVVPRAVASAVSTSTFSERQDGVVVIVIGDDATEGVAIIDAQLADVFSIPLGRKPLIVELSRACSVSQDVVGKLDLNLLLSRVPDDPIAKRVRTVTSVWSTALFTAIRRRLDDRGLTWRLQSGIVIANQKELFPQLDEQATRVVGTPGRFAVSELLSERVAGASAGSFAALGLIPLQWSAWQSKSAETAGSESVVPPSTSVRIAEPAHREGMGKAIGRWLREFVPADHQS